ncbi:hypothetical protein BBM40_16200 [Vibrio parahaemolyticus]|uniref:DUF4435 domain-containing protein n=1 Tax=Vibrio parahaemolyticus TaxID=670 RepID=UPI00084A3608|nr:DUF4435 domain-containing protein [Vibrio parahaemolyticus]ODZ47881.1 hypothetical protein BBM40_16200 [Vibrio parahaemolyticus]HCG7966421.1 DUF4435 domain-containing protein [Vibrio parahaemolyticus]
MAIVEGFSPDFVDPERDSTEFIFTGVQCDIACYVEAEIDVDFWEQRFECQGLNNVDVRPIGSVEDGNGKQAIIAAVTRQDEPIVLSKAIVASLDSDYDNLLELNQDFYHKYADFVFQTYAYAIENFHYHPERLAELVQEWSGIQHNENSEIISNRVLEWSTEHYKRFIFLLNGRVDSVIDREAMSKLANSFSYSDIKQCTFGHVLPQDVLDWFTSKGVSPETMFLYYRGHNFESMMNQCIRDYLTFLRQIKREEILNNQDIEDKGSAINTLFKEDLKIEDKVKSRNLGHIDLVQRIDRDIAEFKKVFWPQNIHI